MKRLPISTFCAFLLMATSILLPSATDAKKLKWKPITANQSGVVLDIESYETKYRGTGWDSNYTQQLFRAYLGNSMGPLHIVTRTAVLASGYVWTNRITNCESNIRRNSRFRNSIVGFFEITGNSKAQSYDSDQKFCGARYEIAYYSSSLLSSLKHCYYLSSIPHFGKTADFNPSIQLEICAKKDLNLSIKNPENFFIIDDRNEKVRLDLSYQNLGQKIAALKNPTTSTSSSVSSGSPPSDEEVCAKAINPSDPDQWSKKPEDQSYVKQAQYRGYSSDQCHFMVAGSTKRPESKTLPPKSTKRENSVQSTAPQNQLTDRLKALKKLEDAGLISKEEAAAKRKEILKNL